MSIKIKPRIAVQACDCLALGEVMLRFDPGIQRIRKTNSFEVYEGGGEYNVVQGLNNCFGLNTSILTALVDNEIGQLIASMIARSGVDNRYIQWHSFDGIGREMRNGLYFMERGYGVRGAKAVMDRGHTAIAQLQVTDIDWTALLTEIKPRWFHVGGIMAGLSEHSPQVVKAAMLAAREVGAVVSFDMNYRESLWSKKGGRQAAARVDEQLIVHADVLFGVDKLAKAVNSLEVDVFSQALIDMSKRYPNLKSIVTTMRVIKDASRNLWSGVCWHQGQIIQANSEYDLAILDRVGGGDAFAAGFIYGMLEALGAQKAIDLATAHGALVMSTPGDNSMSSLEEVMALAQGGDASANR